MMDEEAVRRPEEGGAPKKNRCTWKVATLFLTTVFVGLILAWQLFPAEKIVAGFLPAFDAPENPYVDDGTNSDTGVPTPKPTTSPTEASESFACGNSPADEPCCNGSPANCALKLNQAFFATVHNAMSSLEGGFILGYNHLEPLEGALDAGYRGINVDVCDCGGELQLCHNVCDLGPRIPLEVFDNLNAFLDDHPTEVIVLLLQATNPKDGGTGPSWTDLHAEMVKAGDGKFAQRMYVHPNEADPGGAVVNPEWPTLGELVESDKRIVTFYFNGGTCLNNDCPPGFHFLYDHAAETQFKSESLTALRDHDFSCELTRGPIENKNEAEFFIVNDFVTPPDEDAARTANSDAFLASRVAGCDAAAGMRANFIFVDFWSIGVAPEFAMRRNAETVAALGGGVPG